MLFSEHLHRARALLLPAPGGARRLGIDGDDVVAPAQLRERRDREVWRSHEDDAHVLYAVSTAWRLTFLSSFFCLVRRRMIMLRFRFEM